jgi:membrane-associated phospholipid phosphatase
MLAGGFLLRTYNKQELFTSINTRSSSAGDAIMYYVTMMGQAEIIIPLLLLLMIVPAFRNWWYFITAALCNLVPFFIQHFIKSWLNFPRPMLVIKDRALIHFSPDWPVLLHTSFPSGHSEGAFSFFCFLSLLLPVSYRRYGFFFFLLALSVCYSRIYLAAHFFEDVYVGSMIGAIMTILVYSLMFSLKKYFFKSKDVIS